MPDPTPEEIAGGLNSRQAETLHSLAIGRRLGLADRRADRDRQALRKAGLMAHCGKPKRWQITDLGLAVHAHLNGEGERG